MPSKSPAQHRLMEAAAHTPGGYGGVPQSVGQEFAAADSGKPKTRKKVPQRDGLRKVAMGMAMRLHKMGS